MLEPPEGCLHVLEVLLVVGGLRVQVQVDGDDLVVRCGQLRLAEQQDGLGRW